MPILEWQFPSVPGAAPSAALAVRGPILPVTVAPLISHVAPGMSTPAPVSGYALIDTGVAMTSVDESVCKSLGLVPSGAVPLGHAGGTGVHYCYPVEIAFPGTQLPPFQQPMAVSVNLQSQSPIIVLFGRDLLSVIKFTYNGVQGRFEIAF